MNKANYVVRRIVHSIPVLFFITLIAFFSIRLVPGDPALAILGDKASAEAVQAFHVKYGLDQNIFIQYFDYLRSLIRFDFGTSLKYNEAVSTLLGSRIIVTLSLTFLSFLFTILISFPLSCVAGLKKDRPVDRTIRLVSQIALAIPAFWLSLVFLDFFGVKLHWFPTSGWGEDFQQHMKSLILPALTQAIAVSAITIRNLRGSIINVKDSEYVQFARSKGIPEKEIRSKYILKNSLLPSVTILSMQLVSMIGGSVVIESVYTLPGIGALLIDSIYARDYAIIQTTILFYGVEVLVIFLLTDLLYMLLDPRVKLD